MAYFFPTASHTFNEYLLVPGFSGPGIMNNLHSGAYCIQEYT